MTAATQPLSPKMFGWCMRTLRTAQNLSQDALSEACGLIVRTIQRVEAGARASLTTRRCLARGLGYDDPDMFDTPAFVETATACIETVLAERAEAESRRHPDHLRLEASPVAYGAEFGSQIESCDAWVFHCDEEAPADAQVEAAGLFDNLQDYADIWSDLPLSGRLEANHSFTDMLEALRRHGMRAYRATRRARLAADHGPVPFTIGYVAIVPIDRELSHLFVLKRGYGA
jgi:transcriptional regulator with XRE-family HTH domain